MQPRELARARAFDIVDVSATALFWVVVMLGTITAVGGGVVRDILINRLPAVLSTSVYATAAAAGAAAYLICVRRRLPAPVALAIAVIVAAGLRVAAVIWDWQLPHVTVSSW